MKNNGLVSCMFVFVLNVHLCVFVFTLHSKLRERNVSVNVWVVNERWLFSLLWCSGVTSVTTNACHIFKEMKNPDWHLVGPNLLFAITVCSAMLCQWHGLICICNTTCILCVYTCVYLKMEDARFVHGDMDFDWCDVSAVDVRAFSLARVRTLEMSEE